MNRLRERDEITDGVGPSKLIKSWPPANKEWTTKAVRDAFFSSPSLPRLLNPNAIRRTIADGVNQKLIAYAGRANGGYSPLVFEPETGMIEADIELSEDMVILRAGDARLLKEPPRPARIEIRPSSATVKPGESMTFGATCLDQHGRPLADANLSWSATGGRIDGRGVFVADSEGSGRVQAKVGDLTAGGAISLIRLRFRRPSRGRARCRPRSG
ncbi:MAG: hypothetical protein JWN86_3927 [Planctomycetota bacterium]|nr:hypothetical protein [Planctomycetota bacterium]